MEWLSEETSEEETYFVRKKLRSGLTAYVSLYGEVDPLDKRLYFNVSLVIAKKRKSLWTTDYFDNRTSGAGDLEGLVFAKQALIDFERSMAKGQKLGYIVAGSDSRRHRLYERYLPRMGFVKERRQGEMVMVKRFNT